MTEDAPGRGQHLDRDQPNYLLRAHAAVVVGLLVLFAVLSVLDPPGDGDGVNFGLGWPLLPLIALGLPWTAWIVVAPYSLDWLPTVLGDVVRLAPAVVNIAIHAALFRWWRHRQGRPGGRGPDRPAWWRRPH